MADSDIIARVSECIVKELQTKMCPSPFQSPDDIAIRSPAGKLGDYRLGVWLYDIGAETEASQTSVMEARRNRRRQQPMPYSLYYMVFINDDSEPALKERERYQILGRAAQVIHDSGAIFPGLPQEGAWPDEPPVLLSQEQISLAEKVNLWRAVDRCYQISLFYKASPVLLSSENLSDTPLVKEIIWNTHAEET